MIENRPHQTFFLGVGAEKAGTSWVDRQLAAHPDVWTPPHKEIHYFDAIHLNDGPFYRTVKYDALRSVVMNTDWEEIRTNPEKLATLQWFAKQSLVGDLTDDWYRSLFSDADARFAAVGEITPAYAALPLEGWRHIHRLEPSTRIIFLMREPTHRLWSAIRYFGHNRPESGVLESPERMRQFAARPNNVAKTRYDLTIENLRSVFDERQVLIAFYEDIFASSESQASFLSEVFRFLGVDDTRMDPSQMGAAVNASPPAVMPEELRASLSAEYEPMIKTLEDQLGRVPDQWKG